MRTRTMRMLAGVVAGLVTGLALGPVSGLLSTAGAAPADGPRGPHWRPPADTIVKVEGDADNGFTVHHHDGTTLSPPTLSETIAECGEYDTDVAVTACQVEVETWFRDLADLQVAIAWARYDASRHRSAD